MTHPLSTETLEALVPLGEWAGTASDEELWAVVRQAHRNVQKEYGDVAVPRMFADSLIHVWRMAVSSPEAMADLVEHWPLPES